MSVALYHSSYDSLQGKFKFFCINYDHLAHVHSSPLGRNKWCTSKVMVLEMEKEAGINDFSLSGY